MEGKDNVKGNLNSFKVSVPLGLMKQINELVENGIYASPGDFTREAIRDKLIR